MARRLQRILARAGDTDSQLSQLLQRFSNQLTQKINDQLTQFREEVGKELTQFREEVGSELTQKVGDELTRFREEERDALQDLISAIAEILEAPAANREFGVRIGGRILFKDIWSVLEVMLPRAAPTELREAAAESLAEALVEEVSGLGAKQELGTVDRVVHVPVLAPDRATLRAVATPQHLGMRAILAQVVMLADEAGMTLALDHKLRVGRLPRLLFALCLYA